MIENPINHGLADEFMEMGIGKSREQMIQSIQRIPLKRRVLKLPLAIISRMRYGATFGLRLTSALLGGAQPDLGEAHRTTDSIVAAMFRPAGA